MDKGALGKSGKSFMSALYNKVRTGIQSAFSRKAMDLQKLQMSPVSLINYEGNAVGVTYPGYASYIREHPFIGRACYHDRLCIRSMLYGLLHSLWHNACAYSEAFADLGHDETGLQSIYPYRVEHRNMAVPCGNDTAAPLHHSPYGRKYPAGAPVYEKECSFGAVEPCCPVHGLLYDPAGMMKIIGGWKLGHIKAVGKAVFS